MTDPLQKPLNDIIVRLHALRPILVKKMGAEALIFIAENFQKGGFQGATFITWPKRANPKDQARKILFKSGTLFRSPFISYSDARKAVITSSLPYSRIHNEGGTINHPYRETTLYYHADRGGKLHLAKVRTINQQRGISAIRHSSIYHHTTTMPQRRYMGPSPVLDKRIMEMLRKEIPPEFKIIT